ncbi:MAG: acetylornithine/succinylornithine family transaminase [Chloroflexi bacterium]|nr:acetylornithine/succinylornithine family transaminase [Chloroflexota bacterium]
MGATMQTSEIVALETQHDSGVYNKQSIALVRGEGAYLWDADGRQYIDCIGGHGVALVGHAHPVVAEAIAQQASRLTICPPNFPNDQRARLVRALLRLAPAGLERVYFCSSGAEAVEAALKFARLASGRREVVAAMRGFHGRTMGALSATWNKEYRTPFEPLVPGFRHVPYNNLKAMDEAVGDDTAAVLLEVVQGEGGVIPGDGDYLQAVQALCQERGALFLVDEVQTGFGRTGRLWACQHHNLQPDILCLAKGIAGGVPMGAVLTGARVGELPKKVHGSTFGGNPLACAAALATLSVLRDERLPQRAAELGARFMEALRAIPSPLVREVRGLGLMVGMELKRPSGPYLAALASRGVLALQAGATVMRFLPPLVIEWEDLQTVAAEVAAVLTTDASAGPQPDA